MRRHSFNACDPAAHRRRTNTVLSCTPTRGIRALGVVLNTRSSVEPLLVYSTRRELRERVWRTFISRGDNGDAHDNNVIVAQILRLRAARAQLFGFPTHARLALRRRNGKNPQAGFFLCTRRPPRPRPWRKGGVFPNL
jgi:hypothetical protein